MPKRTSDSAPSPRTVARLTLDKPGAYTAGELLSVVSWLRMHADDLERDWQKYNNTGRFTARVIRDSKGLVGK